MDHNKLRNLSLETIRFCENEFPDTEPNFEFLGEEKWIRRPPNMFMSAASFEIVNMDTIDAGLRFGENPVLLNMANPNESGGGWLRGALAQEECIFRKTNIYQHLNRDYITNNPDLSVPFLGLYNSVYTPNVLVVRDSNYQFLNTNSFPRLAFISAAALYNPKMDQQEREITERKIESIIRHAYNKGHDTIILGAFGCGAFNNPPKVVAEIFHKVLKKYKHGYFKKIIFAILSRNDSNFQIFKNEFREF